MLLTLRMNDTMEYMRRALIPVGIAALIVLAGAWYAFNRNPIRISDTKYMPMAAILSLTSSTFKNEEPIPSGFTCDGEGISPPLSWEHVPEGATSFVLIMDDPDALGGTWDHWIVFNIPPTVTGVAEGEEPEGVGGASSFERSGYGGPCPPSGSHRYVFHLYALDTMLDVGEGASKQEILRAMEGHVIAKAELIGTYERSAQ